MTQSTTPSATMTSLPRSGGDASGPPASVWAMVAALVGLFVVLHWEFFYRTSLASIADPNWQHIVVVPFISGYYIFLNRQRLAELPQRVFWPGLALVFLGLFSYVWWIYPGRNDMFRGYSMILTIFGIVLFTLGPAKMRLLWFPIAYLVFAVKVPDSIWERIAFQLTIVASAGSEVLLNVASQLLDFTITKEGQSFVMKWTEDGQLVQHGFDVAGACSGLRMLMAFCALGVAMAFLWDRTWWQRELMMLLAVPVAVGVNIVRVTTLGLLNLINPELSQGDFHIAVGMMMLIPAAILFLGIGKLLDMMLVEPEDAPEPDPREQPVLPSRAMILTNAVLGVVALLLARQFGILTGPVLGIEGAPVAWIDGVIATFLVAVVLFEVFRRPIERFVHRMMWRPSSPLGAAPGDDRAASIFRLGQVLLTGVVLAVLVGMGYLLTLNGVSENPVIEMLGQSASYALAAAALAAVAVLVVLSRGAVRTIVAALVLVIGVLLASAVGLQTVVAKTEIALIKQRVDMRHGFYSLPDQIGPWELVGQDEPLSKYVEDELGTTDYITRYYRDTRLADDDPAGTARVHLAYYTGMIDTVPHVPDRCWVAGGITPGDVRSFETQLTPPGAEPDEEHGGVVVPTQLRDPVDGRASARLPQTTVPLRAFTGINPETGGQISATYFFVANGGFHASPNDVRLLGFDPRDKYSYYCKVEVSFPGLKGLDESEPRVAALLSDLLPEIMACVPDWPDVRAGRWPADPDHETAPAGPDSPAADPADEPN